MFRHAFAASVASPLLRPLVQSGLWSVVRGCAFSVAGVLFVFPSHAAVLWSDPGATLVHTTGAGTDILGGALKRDDSSSDTLYFKFHVEPLSDASTEEYFAAFELYEGDAERLGVGNALKAWAYSAFIGEDEIGKTGKAAGYFDLRTSKPEPLTATTSGPYELPRRGVGRTIVFKVQYVPGGDDLVTVWLAPDLGPGANEVYEPESLTTRFSVNAAFDSIRLRHGGGGEGWIFSGMSIATSFNDFVDTSSAKTAAPVQDGVVRSLPFDFQSWRGQLGMPHNSISALAQTRDGYLWLGGDDGLARFDGVRFVAFGKAELHSAPVRTLLGDKSGRLWIGTGGGLARLEAGGFTTLKKQEGLPDDSISALAEDKDGRLWAGTEGGLAVYENGHFVRLGERQFQSRPVTLLFNDRQGTMWVGVAGLGIFRSSPGGFSQVTDPAVDFLLQDPHCLLVDAGGRLWIGASDDFVLCRETNQWRRYRIPRHSHRPYVKVLAEDSDGTIWAGSVSEGLLQFLGGKLKAVDAGSGLADNRVKSLLVDREGRLWVGTDSGLNRLRHKNFIVFGQDEGLGYGPVFGLAEVSPGVIWAARPNDGLYHWEGKNFNRLTASGLPPRDPQVGALLTTKAGDCLVAHSRGLLRFKDPQAIADESAVAGLSDQSIISLSEDPEGSVWAGTRQGRLWRLVKGQWLEQTNLAESHPITAIAPGNNGLLWVGTDGGGLYRLQGNTHSHYGQRDGLRSDSIRTLYADAQETLWIGTAGGGLSWWRNGRLATLTRREGLLDDTISQILDDDAGNLWLGSDHGIACVNKLDLLQAAGGQFRPLSARFFGRADGLPSEECTGRFFPSALRAKSGLLWFSTSMGVVATLPKPRTNSLPSPTVLIEEIMVDGAPVSMAEKLKIPPGRHRLELQYTALGADAPETLQFRYRLAPLDGDWVEAGGRRTAFYNYVPPGDYRFQVKACERNGAWSETSAGMTVNVSRHFWQSWWVLGPALFTLMAGIAGGIRVVEKRKLQRRVKTLEQERRLERERTRIAQDLHDQMGAKLCRISFLSEHARLNDKLPNDLQREISSISETSREVLHSLDEIVWAVDPQNDTLEHAASYIAQYAQEYFQMTGIQCELSVPAQLPALRISSQMRHHLFLAAHEAFTNILKHSGATQAKVSIECNGTGFQITACDNGAGFNVSNNSPEAAPDGHDGLRNMTKRLTDIGGSCRVESNPGKGTTIHFVVPLVGSETNPAN